MNAALFLDSHALPYVQIFTRVSAIFVLTPILSLQEMPLKVKALLAAGLALVIYPIVAPHVPKLELRSVAFLFGLADTFLVGLLIGLMVQIYYTSFLLAGELYSIQLGFGIVNVLDPLSETPIPILGQIKSLLAAFAFLVMNGHHTVIEALVASFQFVPHLTLAAAQPLATALLLAGREMFIISFQLAAPIMGTLFLVEMVMGILSKVAPQMNIMVAGFQIKIVVGLILLIATMPAIYTIAQRLFDRAFSVLDRLMRVMQ